MKQHTFRVTQPLRGYYEAELKIQVSSKKKKLKSYWKKQKK